MSDTNGALTFRSKNRSLVARAVEILRQEKPMTLRQLYYRLISAGVIKNAQQEYKRLGSVMTRLREEGNVPRTWIVDHVRATLKPSSWTGLADYGEAIKQCYRKDFWPMMPHHVEVFVEKDAVAGTIQPVTEEYDVALRVCRGYCSVSFAGEIADLWRDIEKPIYAYYLGDFDPSGFDLERDLREKLKRYSNRPCMHDLGDEHKEWRLFGYYEQKGRPIFWARLAVQERDFVEHDLIRLPVKDGDRRSKKFVEQYGRDCAEVDALPPGQLRDRVEAAIHNHIDQDQWQRLLEIEGAEKKSIDRVMKSWEKRKLTLIHFHVCHHLGPAPGVQ